MEIREPVCFALKFDKSITDSLYLNSYRINVKMKKLKTVKKSLSNASKETMLFIFFPQVYYKGEPLLPEEKSHRMALLYFDKDM